ncbi:MFS general substrate transporter [Coprinopsis marcescibilis]|uniref:MFS general substrate transporter n=1 Tax=Coprinopsis marcescibilis TaxID=230819 RepID=A0A5C3KWQ0_COPMA|nr:MFS general substrate transporter [Coprinopsis marcescibilis]
MGTHSSNQASPDCTPTEETPLLARRTTPPPASTAQERLRVLRLACCCVYYVSTLTSAFVVRVYDSHRQSEEQLDLLTSRFMIAVAAFGGPVGGLLAGWVSKRRGRRSALLISLFLTISGSLSMALVDPSFSTLIQFSRGLQSIAVGSTIYLAISLVSEVSCPEKLGSGIGSLYASLSLGQAVSAPLYILLLSLLQASWRNLQYIITATGSILFCFVLIYLPRTKRQHRTNDDALDGAGGDATTNPPSPPSQSSSELTGFSLLLKTPRLRAVSTAVVPAVLSFWIHVAMFSYNLDAGFLQKPKKTRPFWLPLFAEFVLAYGLGGFVGALWSGHASDRYKARHASTLPEAVLRVCYPGIAFVVPVLLSFATFSTYAAFLTSLPQTLEFEAMGVAYAFFGGAGAYAVITPSIVYMASSVPASRVTGLVAANDLYQILATSLLCVTLVPFALLGQRGMLLWAILSICSCWLGFSKLRKVVRAAEEELSATSDTGEVVR